jgi:hypothetical protein
VVTAIYLKAVRDSRSGWLSTFLLCDLGQVTKTLWAIVYSVVK